MQIGEIFSRAFSATINRLHVSDQLDQVARDEAGREAEMAQRVHQQPRRVTAGAFSEAEAFFRSVNPRLHAHDIGNLALNQAVDVDQLINRALLLPRNFGEQGGEQWPRFLSFAEGSELFLQHRIIGEGECLGVRLQEEVERVDGRHIGDEINLHVKMVHFLRENHAGEEVALRILLPIEEVGLW